MLKSLKNTVITLFIITVIIAAGIFMFYANKTFYNDEDEIGNTSGNIYNGGLFCEKDGMIYFSNDIDDGSLYVMTSECGNIRKLHNDKVVFINVDENYIYYARANNLKKNNPGEILMFNNTGIYRINQNGKNTKAITTNPGAYLALKGNYLYYQLYDVEDGLWVYRKKIDTEDDRLLTKEAIIPAAFHDNRMYYAGNTIDHNINSINLSSFTKQTNYEGNYAFPIFMDDYIYFLDLSDNYSICRMKQDESKYEVLVDERCSTYNITNSGEYLYYQVDDLPDSKICRLNLKTMENEKILDGNYKQIHVTDNFVFFKEYETSCIFVQQADGYINLGTFNPPKLTMD